MATKTEKARIIEFLALENVLVQVGGQFQEGCTFATEKCAKIVGISQSQIYNAWSTARDWAPENCLGFSERRCMPDCHKCSEWAKQYVADSFQGGTE